MNSVIFLVNSVRKKHKSVGFYHQKSHRTSWFRPVGSPLDNHYSLTYL